MSLRVELIDPPSFVGGGGNEAKQALQALKSAGPYEMGECPSEPTLLFVFPEEYKDQANRLFLALKNGVGPFPGTERLFRFKLTAKRALRISGFSYKRGEPHDQVSRRYADAIDRQMQTLGGKPDIALVLHPRTDKWNKQNAYLEAKFRLLCANIPAQSVTLELLDNAQALPWSVGNIALAMFAKMGGRPWATHIATELPSDSLVVGVNRAFAGNVRAGAARKVFGFATAFSNKGVYLETKLFPVAGNWAEYLRTLEASLNELIADWQKRNGQPISLVFHLQRELRRDEQAIIQSCLASASNRLVREHAVVRLSDDSGMLIADEARPDSFTPRSGTLIYLAGHRALLQVAGSSVGPTVGKIVTASPLQLTKLTGSSGSPPLSVLASHILALAYMNWRGFNSEAWPVSIDYPREFAKLLGRFSDANLDITRLSNLSVMKRPWFL